jgi:hypothetical protein
VPISTRLNTKAPLPISTAFEEQQPRGEDRSTKITVGTVNVSDVQSAGYAMYGGVGETHRCINRLETQAATGVEASSTAQRLRGHRFRYSDELT